MEESILTDEVLPDNNGQASIPYEEETADDAAEPQDLSPEAPELQPQDLSGDLDALKAEFPELQYLDDIAKLKNPTRYAALRDLGLSAKEAYLATSEIRAQRDNRAHLGGSVPRAAGAPASAMSARELREARALFGNISDSELLRLYKRVTSN